MESLQHNAWIRTCWGGMTWVVANGWDPAALERVWSNAQEPDRHPDCRVVQRNILRTSILAALPGHAGSAIFLKRHHRRHWRDDARSLLIPSRAYNEWKTLLHFQRLGLPAPAPIAYGEQRCRGVLKDSCLMTTALADVQPIVPGLLATLAGWKPREQFLFRRELVDQLGSLIGRLHNAGVFFRDLHGGNILCRTIAGKPLELFFVDTDKAWFFSRLSRRRRIADLAALYNSVFSSSLSLWARFLIAYQATSGSISLTWRDLLMSVRPVAAAFQKRHLVSRSKRCLRESTAFGVAFRKDIGLYYRKTLSTVGMDAACAYIVHQCRQSEAQADQQRLGRNMVPSPEPGSIWFASIYRYPASEKLRSLVGPSAAKKAWITGNALAARDVPVMMPLVLAERKQAGMVSASCLISSHAVDA